MYSSNKRGAKWLSSDHRAFRDRTWDAWIFARPPDAYGEKYITRGAWKVTIAAYWPRQRHLDLDLAMGDCDAPIKAILDALEFAGVIDDDARIVEIEARKFWDKESPRVEVILLWSH